MTKQRNACIIVLGDIGRSPRMQYHAASFLQENYNVDIIGYVETKPLQELCSSQPKCSIHKLAPVPDITLPLTIKLIIKTIWQALTILIALISVRRPSFILVQNPPGIPTLAVAFFYCLMTRTPWIIDWHNYTYTILSLNTLKGEKSRICCVAKWMESWLGSKANANFCVTNAMKQDLRDNWQIKNITVLYDRPPLQFRPVDMSKKHDFFMKLSKDFCQFLPDNLDESEELESTALTIKLKDGTVMYKPKRMAILVSSTSWTADEDFSILLKALKVYDRKAIKQSEKFPFLLCIITGKGPQKEEYMKQIKVLNFSKVDVITPWLEIQDYPLVLAAADLGVSLHLSSSGLDLPMKVVDMFGCGLPVCAKSFKCLNELVRPGVNGFIFNDYQELAEQILYWFENFPNNSTINESKQLFFKNLKTFQNVRWHENWLANAFPTFNSFI